ncbi:hypothetical protein JXR93_08830 [bacterium]|nr:hypothetical protein [bacterium]
MRKDVRMYQVFLVKPYFKNGEKFYSYTQIGVAFKKEDKSSLDLRLDLFPVLITGAFIQLRPVKKGTEEVAA